MDENDFPKLDRGPRKVYRSRSDRMVFGVCGGVAEYYNIESLWVRLVFIFLGITGAIGFLLYLALAFLMPLDLSGVDKTGNLFSAAGRIKEGALELSAEWRAESLHTERRRNLLGLVIVAIGVIAFYNELFPEFWIGWKILWPVVIILIGFSLISDRKSGK
ncbi:MAG: PspC domain-containing protein [Candidatus Vogelbacteria bacterium]|nr:PspC domain-containing protein [Candidatus Vogelbacteria bacterium]